MASSTITNEELFTIEQAMLAAQNFINTVSPDNEVNDLLDESLTLIANYLPANYDAE